MQAQAVKLDEVGIGGVAQADLLRLDYTEWRRRGLPDYSLEELARLASIEATKLSVAKYYIKGIAPC